MEFYFFLLKSVAIYGIVFGIFWYIFSREKSGEKIKVWCKAMGGALFLSCALIFLKLFALPFFAPHEAVLNESDRFDSSTLLLILWLILSVIISLLSLKSPRKSYLVTATIFTFINFIGYILFWLFISSLGAEFPY